MGKKKRSPAKVITNRRVHHDYEISDALIVGIKLSGAETKSLRMGHGQLRGSYVVVKDNELFLINATINGTSGILISETEQTQPRKLLAKKREIAALITAKQQGRTIVPLEMATGGRYIKLKIAIGKGKKKYDKRQVLKARDEKRSIQSVLKKQAY